MLDLGKAENFVRKIAGRRKEVVYARSAWFLVFMVFLLVAGGVNWGDLILLGFLQLVFFLVLFLPEQHARGHLRLQALAVVDFIFLVLGLGMTQNSSVPVLLFFSSFFLSCYLARNLRTLTGFTFFFMGLILVLGFQDWFRWAPFFPAASVGNLALLEMVVLVLAVYLAFLGLPANPLLATHEKYRGVLHAKKMLLELMARVNACRSVKEILAECRNALSEGIPGCQADVIVVVDKKGGIWNPSDPEAARDEFSVENIPNLKKALTSAEAVIAQFAAERPRGRLAATAPPAAEAWTEIYLPAQYEREHERGFCFRVILTHRALLEEEKDLLQAVRECAAAALRHVQGEDALLAERKDLATRVQQLQRENVTVIAMRDLLAQLNTVQELDAGLDATHNILHQVIGHDSLLLFFSAAGGTLMELVELRSRTNLVLSRGFTLPASNTMVGEAVRKRKILYKGSLKTGEGTGPVPEDVPHWVRNGFGSLFVLPLSEADNAPPYGALVIAHRVAGHFRMDQVELLAQLQGALGFGVRRCLSHRSSIRKLAESEAVLALGAVVNSEQHPIGLAREVGAVLERTMHYDLCQMYLFHPPTEELIAAPREGEELDADRDRISVRSKDFVAHVWRTRNGYATGNTMKDPYCPDTESMPASRAAVPVLYHDEMLGILDATVYRENAFAEGDLRFLSFAGSLAGLALANAHTAQKIERQMAADPLTNLGNRQHFLERLEAELSQHIRRREPLALLMAGVDGMEQLNAAHGYGAGDQVLRRTADAVRSHCRKGDQAARWGGDCLAMILVGADLTYALKLGQKLGEAIRKQPELETLKVNLSVGAAAFPQHGQTAAALVSACRQSLAQARTKGPGSLAYPETETYLIGGRSVQLNTAALYQEILGKAQSAGPHTRDTLGTMINRLQQAGGDVSLLGEVLHRLITKLDYPDRHQEILTTMPELVRRLGLEMKLNEQRIRYLQLAYKIYDIGKFTVPQDILYAARPLSEAERQAVMNHVNVAVQDILNPHKVFAPLLAVVKFHHERWDGSGYPWRLKQEEIPLEARILGLVDVFRALTTDRPYRPRCPVPEALETIRQMRGSLFEEELVDAILRVADDLKIG